MKLYTYAEAAEKLRVEEKWLRRNISRLPRSKKGRVVTFTEDDLARIDAMFHLEPDTATPTAAGTKGPHPLAELVPLPARRSARA